MIDARAVGLIYVGDPMCSWCWGFAPVLEGVASEFDLEVEVVVGGLRPGPAAESLSPRLEQFLRQEWTQIGRRTGQPFDVTILDELGTDWMYDSELAAVAVTQMRRASSVETLPFFVRLQKAFYSERIDITAIEAYRPLTAEFDVDVEAFLKSLTSEEARKEAWADFSRARRWGITGFPTLLARRGDRLHLVSAGYRSASEISQALSTLL